MAAEFGAVGIAVSDLAASVAFYRLLGLHFATDGDTGGHMEAELPGGLRFMLDSQDVMKSFDPDWVPPAGRGRIGLAFACEDAAGVDATHALVVAAGHRSHLDPFDAFWGQRYAAVLDPDGNVVDLYAPLETVA